MLSQLSLGIVSGAGPMAGCLLYRLIIEQCQSQFRSIKDDEFPKVLMISYPFSEMLDRSTSAKNKNKLEYELKYCLELLRESKVDRIAIACNTLHTVLQTSDLNQDQVIDIRIPVLRVLKLKKIKSLLVLGTETTLRSQYYSRMTQTEVLPDQILQQCTSEVILEVLRGSYNADSSNRLKDLLDQAFFKDRFESVLLGCTELSVLQNIYPIESKEYQIIDPLVLLSKALINGI